MIMTLGAGCADNRTVPGTDSAQGNAIVGSWLEEGSSPDLLLHFYPNKTAYVRFLLTVQNQKESTVTRQGTWESLPEQLVNLSYTAPFTMENRTFTFQVNKSRMRVVHVYNETGELLDSRQGRITTSFIRVSDTWM
ncbi:MAG: hypothetical protein ABFC89_13385 [Methanospirillum sp.]